MAILLLAILHIALFLVSVESRPGPPNGDGNFDDFLNFTTPPPDYKSKFPWAECTLKCVEKYVGIEKATESPFSTPEQLEPLCRNLDCIDKCEGAYKVALLLDFVCFDEDYNSSVGCMNEKLPKITRHCLNKSGEEQNTTVSLPIGEIKHKEICQTLITYYRCIGRNMNIECNRKAAVTFRYLSKIVLSLISCSIF